MCGRFTLKTPEKALVEAFELFEVPELEPRYNIAPSQKVPVVRVSKTAGQRELWMLRWGLIPAWADDPSIGSRMINARAETASTKPAFRSAFRHRRCLVVADGFYEWQKRKQRKKQPFYIRMRDERPFAFAGLWECWEAPDRSSIESCTILTTEANELIQPLHSRMPVVLHPSDYSLWVDPDTNDPRLLQPLLCPYLPDQMTAFPVSTQVNNPSNDEPTCVEPLP